jgi:flagellar motility protein MotE (MotC chaperone)
MPVYDQVKQALQDILAPEIQALKAEIKRLDERISGLEEKMNARMSGLEEKNERPHFRA